MAPGSLQGRQAGADSYRQLLSPHGLQPSMSRQGHGWGNAVTERVFHPLTTALIDLADLKTHEHAGAPRAMDTPP